MTLTKVEFNWEHRYRRKPQEKTGCLTCCHLSVFDYAWPGKAICDHPARAKRIEVHKHGICDLVELREAFR